MRRFIINALKTALILGAALRIFDLIGPMVTGDYFRLIWWGLVVFSTSVLAFIGWRFWAGVQSGRLLFDDPNE